MPMSRMAKGLGLFATLIMALVVHACTDGGAPFSPDGSGARIGLRLAYSQAALMAAAETLPINEAHVVALNADTEAVLADTTFSVPAEGDSIELSVHLELSETTPVVLEIELLHTENGTSTVQWSGRAEVTVDPGSTEPQSVPVEVWAGPLDNESVTAVGIVGPIPEMVDGDSLDLTAEISATDSDSQPEAVWMSLAPTVLESLGGGRFAAVAPGTAGVVAMAGNYADTAEVVVFSATPPTVTITHPANDASFFDDEPVLFEGSADDVEDGALTGESLVWTSDLDGTFGTGTSFSADTLSVGLHEITLSATDRHGNVGSASVSVSITVDDPPVVTITAPDEGAQIVQGTEVVFSGTAEDPEEGVLPDSLLVWTSSLDGEIGRGASVTTTQLSAGAHEVILTATDSRGNSATDTLAVTVGGPATITGTVLRSNDQTPFTGIGAILSAEGAVLDTAYTDAAGQYAFGGLEPGSYTVSLDGMPPFGTYTTGAAEQSVTVALDETATRDVGFEVPVVELSMVASDTTPTAGDTIRLTLILKAPTLPQDLAGAAGFVWNPDPTAWDHGDVPDVPDSWTTDFDELALGDDEADSLRFAVASSAGEPADSVVVLSAAVWTEVFGVEPFTPNFTPELDQLETVDPATGETTPLLDFVLVHTDTLTLDVFDPCTQQESYTVGTAVNGTLEGGDCIWRVQEDSLGAAEYLYVDDYRFSVGSQLHGVVEASSSAFALRWDLVGLLDPVSHTKQIYSQDFVGAEGIMQDSLVRRRILIPAGDYGLLMWPLSQPATGAYSFGIEDVGTHDVNGCGQPYRVFVRRGTQTSGSISAEDCYDAVGDSLGSPGRHFDLFWVHLRGGETLTVTFQGSDSTAAVAIWGANPDTGEWESKAFHHGGTQTVQISHTAVQGGYFEVDPIGEPGMTYDISFEVTGSPSAPPRVPGQESRPPDPPSVVPPGRH